MESLILYETKKGCTKKCAEYVQQKNVGATLLPLRDFNGSIKDYKSIVILTPVYIGQINKKVKKFIEDNQNNLLNVPLNIVIIGMNVKEYDNMLKTNFSKEVLSHSNIVYGGGAYYLDKLNFLQRFIIKKVANVIESIEDIKYKNLDKIKL